MEFIIDNFFEVADKYIQEFTIIESIETPVSEGILWKTPSIQEIKEWIKTLLNTIWTKLCTLFNTVRKKLMKLFNFGGTEGQIKRTEAKEKKVEDAAKSAGISKEELMTKLGMNDEIEYSLVTRKSRIDAYNIFQPVNMFDLISKAMQVDMREENFFMAFYPTVGPKDNNRVSWAMAYKYFNDEDPHKKVPLKNISIKDVAVRESDLKEFQKMIQVDQNKFERERKSTVEKGIKSVEELLKKSEKDEELADNVALIKKFNTMAWTQWAEAMKERFRCIVMCTAIEWKQITNALSKLEKFTDNVIAAAAKNG